MFRRSVGDTSKQPYFHLSACRRSSGAGIQSAIQGEWVFTRRIEDCAKPPAPGVSQARVKKLTVAMTKTQLFSDIAENTALTRRQVADVFEALESIIERHVQKGAVGACTIPGLMKIKVMKKPAQRARKNVPNPFRPGETMDVKAKPASTSVKVLPLKKLKDMA